MADRLYHLDIRCVTWRACRYVEVAPTKYERLSVEPMTHKEAITMKSKFHPERQSRILLVEVTQEGSAHGT